LTFNKEEPNYGLAKTTLPMEKFITPSTPQDIDSDDVIIEISPQYYLTFQRET
jgi:hypothetical protein